MNQITAMQTQTSPTMHAIMTSDAPPAEMARTMAEQLNAWIDEYARLNSSQRSDLRLLVFALSALAFLGAVL